MKQIEVTILGQSYRLMCPDDGEDALRSAVQTVDDEMSAIRDAGKVKARERMAVLAALNLAYRLAERVPTPEVYHSVQHDDPEGGVPHDTIDRLVRRIDGALRNDGHLL
jgi:cell division protein ZapA